MSKELIEVGKDSFKSKLKDAFLIFLIIGFGVLIMFGSFYVAYTKGNRENNIAENDKYIEIRPNSESDNNYYEEKDDKNIVEDDNKIIVEEESQKEKNNKLPEWTNTAIADIKAIYGSDEKQVYLTFDDGPSEEVTPHILDILEEEKIPATFFVLGKCVDRYPELVKQEYENGHFIANHGYTHTYSQIYASVDNVVNEYNKTNESIRNAIGNPDYDCHLFRFPGGSSGGPYNSLKAQAKQYLADNNVASTNWNCLTSDAAGNTTVNSQYQGALETQGNNTSLIILMHDAADKKVTPETLKLLIKHYKEEGYEFKNFYEIFNGQNIVEENSEENVENIQ